jgi:ubiquinone/menaquinone biosynthesis C-methylase UbiE
MEFRKGANAWGAPEGLPLRWTQLRQRQAREVLDFLRDESVERKEVFCDLSAGAGYCTFEASQKYRVVFHCDLSADSLAYAAAKAKRNQLENIIFVRADYFQPPFRNAIHHLVCLDTLIRGPWHEAAVLASVRRILASRGVAVVDFHNWWHNPLRRMGILRENFRGNKSYTRKELKKLLVATGINRFRTKGFIQEVDPAHVSGQILSRWIPPTRLMVRLERESVSPS